MVGSVACCVHMSSDILVQIVDARNPLLFRCEDLVSTGCWSVAVYTLCFRRNMH